MFTDKLNATKRVRDITVDKRRTRLHHVTIGLFFLFFSVQVMALQQPENAPHYSDYGIDTVSLSNIYPHTADFLWMENQELNTRALDALAFIANASKHGLDPDNYHFDFLQQFELGKNQADNHLFDLMLTDGLLKLMRDITVGRLDPAVVDPEWSIPRAHFDAVSFLQAALSKEHFKASLNSLIPVSDNYHQIKAAIELYQDYADRGGWSSIPATPLLKPGDYHENIPAIRDRLRFVGYRLVTESTLLRDVYDDQLVQAVKDFQRQHSISIDGIIGPATLRTMNISTAARLKQVKLALERLRWLPDDLGKRYILVNLANYRLTAIDDDEVKLNMRVIVGKTQRSTPSFSSKMTHIVLNPHWYVPTKLARLDLLPRQQRDPGYFDRLNIRVFGTVDGIKTEINPHSVDWHTVDEQHFPYSLRQDPGNKNALGRMKFIMPNPWSIYLHDTPSKSLFNYSQRNFSAGCIRVEDPLALANFSLNRNSKHQALRDIISSKESYTTKLEEPIAVYTVYATVWFDGSDIVFAPDSYQRDLEMAKYL